MNSSKDAVEVILQAEAEQKKLDEQKILAEQLAEEERLKAARAQAQSEDGAPQVAYEVQSFKTENTTSARSDFKKILDDYREKYPDNNIQGNQLPFTDMESAKSFFQEQASKQPPRAFLASVHEDGKATGQYFMSCGTGTLYEGTYDEIKAKIEEDLLASDKDSPEHAALQEGIEKINKLTNNKNVTSEFRGALKAGRTTMSCDSGPEQSLTDYSESQPSSLSRP